MNLSGLHPKYYVNFNNIPIGNGNNKNTKPPQVIPTTPNMNQPKQTTPNMNQQKKTTPNMNQQKQTTPNMNQQKQKQKQTILNMNQQKIIGPRKSTRIELKSSRIIWPRDDLKFELYAFNFKNKNDKSSPNTSGGYGITEDIINKQFGLRTIDNGNNIIFKKDDEVVGFYKTCELSKYDSKKVIDFFDGKIKEEPTNMQIFDMTGKKIEGSTFTPLLYDNYLVGRSRIVFDMIFDDNTPYLFPWWYYLNYSNDPNLKVDFDDNKKIKFIALKDISSNTPLTFRYESKKSLFPSSIEKNKQTILQCQYNITKQIQELTEEEKTILEEKYNKRIMESTGNKKETNKINPMNRLNMTTSRTMNVQNMTTSRTMNVQKQTTPQITSQQLAKLLFLNKKKRKRTYQSDTSSSTQHNPTKDNRHKSPYTTSSPLIKKKRNTTNSSHLSTEFQTLSSTNKNNGHTNSPPLNKIRKVTKQTQTLRMNQQYEYDPQYSENSNKLLMEYFPECFSIEKRNFQKDSSVRMNGIRMDLLKRFVDIFGKIPEKGLIIKNFNIGNFWYNYKDNISKKYIIKNDNLEGSSILEKDYSNFRWKKTEKEEQRVSKVDIENKFKDYINQTNRLNPTTSSTTNRLNSTTSSTTNRLNPTTSTIKTKTPVKNNKKMYSIKFQGQNGIDTVDLVPENLIKKIEKQVTSRTRSGNVKKQLEIGDRVKVLYSLGGTRSKYYQGEIIGIYSKEK